MCAHVSSSPRNRINKKISQFRIPLCVYVVLFCVVIKCFAVSLVSLCWGKMTCHWSFLYFCLLVNAVHGCSGQQDDLCSLRFMNLIMQFIIFCISAWKFHSIEAKYIFLVMLHLKWKMMMKIQSIFGANAMSKCIPLARFKSLVVFPSVDSVIWRQWFMTAEVRKWNKIPPLVQLGRAFIVYLTLIKSFFKKI